MFLPNCQCCGTPGCRCGQLPHTITAAFSEFLDPDGAAWTGHNSDSTCFGTGASIGYRRLGGGETPATGPIQEVKLVNPGRCYAERDRVLPVLVAFGGGRGAVFEVVMEPAANDGCGRPRWRIASISVAGGSGYTNNSLLTITPSAGDVTLTAAVARVQTVSGVPQSVTIQNSGLYYRPITGDRDFPIVTATVGNAKLGVALERLDGEPARWKVSYVSVLLPGSGLSTGQPIVFAVGDRTTQTTAAAATLVANADGQAVSVTITEPGEYFRNTALPPRVIEPTFTIAGSPAAVVRGLVDDDPDSETFGHVVDLVIDNAGNGIGGWTDQPRCQVALNGRQVVLRAADSQTLITPCISSCHGSGAELEVVSHTRPQLSGRIDGQVSFNVVVEPVPGSAPRLWRVAALLPVFPPFNTSVGDPIEITTPNNQFMSQHSPLRVFTVTPALAQISAVDENGVATAVTVTEPGAYYSQEPIWDGVPGPLPGIRFRLGQNLLQGSGYALRGRVAPSLSATAGGSSQMAVALTEKTDSCDVPFWEIDEITPSGSNVTDRRVLTIQRDALDTQAVQALAVVSTREEPTVTAEPPEPQTDFPATFAVTLTKTAMVIPPRATLTPGSVPLDILPAYWSVTGIEITNPGSGYPTVTRLDIEVTNGTETKPAAARAFANAAGEIVDVVIETGGEYFLDNGVPQDVTIVRPGVYYREDSSLPPYVATPTVSLTQIPPSNGSGAVIQLEVDTDTASASFGRIINATIPQGQGGTGYHMRSGPRPGGSGPPQYVHGCTEQDSLIRIFPVASGFSASLTSGISSDTGLPSALTGTLVSTRDGDTCADWFTNPLTPVGSLSAGKIEVTAGGRFSDWVGCCYCPCFTDGFLPLGTSMADFRYLEGCGIQKILVDVTVTPKEPGPGIINECPGKTATIELSPANDWGGVQNLDFARVEDDDWILLSGLFCSGARGRLSVAVFAVPKCEVRLNGLLVGFSSLFIPLPTTPLEDLRICCPSGAEGSNENDYWSLAATVTVVMT